MGKKGMEQWEEVQKWNRHFFPYKARLNSSDFSGYRCCHNYLTPLLQHESSHRPYVS